MTPLNKFSLINLNMNVHKPDPAKKVKYIASILYLLVFTFIVAGSYIHQQQPVDENENIEVIQADKPLIE